MDYAGDDQKEKLAQAKRASGFSDYLENIPAFSFSGETIRMDGFHDLFNEVMDALDQGRGGRNLKPTIAKMIMQASAIVAGTPDMGDMKTPKDRALKAASFTSALMDEAAIYRQAQLQKRAGGIV
jgi:hypothetical protein